MILSSPKTIPLRQPRGTSRHSSSRGIALLMVLWIVAVISILGLSFSFGARTEVVASTAYGAQVRDRFAAEAGVLRAIGEILHARGNGEEPWSLEGGAGSGTLAHSGYTVSILPEESRIDINRSSPLLLRGLLVNLGVDPGEADAIVDAVQDWRDPDDLVRTQGAEGNYYHALDPPYEPANADFQTLEELRLVRGISSALWVGTDGKKGLRDLLTVYSPTGKIDPNTAAPEVLGAVESMTEDSIAEILSLREDDTALDSAAQTRMLELAPEAAALVAAASRRTYRIRSTAARRDGRSPVHIEAVVTFQGSNPEIVYWNGRSPEPSRPDSEAEKDGEASGDAEENGTPP